MNKHCRKCDEIKPYADFYKNKARKDGLQVYCKPCHKKVAKINYKKNRKNWVETQKKYRRTEKFRKYHNDWAKKNIGAITNIAKNV